MKPTDQLSFFRRLSLLFSSGVPIHKALSMFGPEDPMFSATEEVSRQIVRGQRLSEAMRARPDAFPPLAVELIRAGESTGALALILETYADYLEAMLRLRRQVESALIYPALVVLWTFLVTVVLAVVLLPRQRELLASLGVDPPWLTRAVMGAGDLILNRWVLILLLGALAAQAFWLAPTGQRRAWLQSLPIVRGIVEKASTYRLLFGMSLMLEVGAGYRAMPQLAALAQNPAMEARFLEALDLMKSEGVLFSQAATRVGLFSPLARHLIRFGEEHGRLATLLRQTARVTEDELVAQLTTLASLAEPVAMLFLGGVVGLIVVASVLPTAQVLRSL